MRFLLVAGLAESLLNFRGALIEALQAQGYQVHVAAPDLPPGSTMRRQLEARNLTVHSIRLRRTGTNPLTDFGTLVALWRLMRKVRPDAVLGYTIKPVVYGSMAAWLAGIPRRFALITGLGYVFLGEGRRGPLQVMVQGLYALALRSSHKVFFQNPDDEAAFRRLKILGPKVPSCVVNGSGVDLQKYSVAGLPAGAHFLMIARLLEFKGVREYAEAARRIRQKFPEVSFSLAGWIDQSPASISQAELDEWTADGRLRFLGRLADVRQAISECSVFVLPSHFGEGTPRTVLEGMAMGRAIITTDSPGCRETVKEGDNGFLVPVRSADALAGAMQRLVEQPELVARMGRRSRELAEERYDVHKVNAMMQREMGIK